MNIQKMYIQSSYLMVFGSSAITIIPLVSINMNSNDMNFCIISGITVCVHNFTSVLPIKPVKQVLVRFLPLVVC